MTTNKKKTIQVENLVAYLLVVMNRSNFQREPLSVFFDFMFLNILVVNLIYLHQKVIERFFNFCCLPHSMNIVHIEANICFIFHVPDVGNGRAVIYVYANGIWVSDGASDVSAAIEDLFMIHFSFIRHP